MGFIKRYIDKKVEERLSLMDLEIRETIKEESKRQIQILVRSLAQDRYRIGPYGPHYSKELKEAFKSASSTIMHLFRDELRNLRDRNESSRNLEREVYKNIQSLVSEKISSEQFIDDIVERIKKKQV